MNGDMRESQGFFRFVGWERQEAAKAGAFGSRGKQGGKVEEPDEQRKEKKGEEKTQKRELSGTSPYVLVFPWIHILHY